MEWVHVRPAILDALRREDPDIRGGQPPQPGRAHRCRRCIQPLQIVQCDKDGAVLGERRERIQKPEADRMSCGGSVPGSMIRNATASASRRGASSESDTSSKIGPTRSDSPANANPASACTLRWLRTRHPRATAASMPASQSTVLPMPGSPVRTRPRTSVCGNSLSLRIAASSSSRPTRPVAGMCRLSPVRVGQRNTATRSSDRSSPPPRSAKSRAPIAGTNRS